MIHCFPTKKLTHQTWQQLPLSFCCRPIFTVYAIYYGMTYAWIRKYLKVKCCAGQQLYFWHCGWGFCKNRKRFDGLVRGCLYTLINERNSRNMQGKKKPAYMFLDLKLRLSLYVLISAVWMPLFFWFSILMTVCFKNNIQCANSYSTLLIKLRYMD